MIVNFKIFHEKTDTDFETYEKMWDENKERFIFLHTSLPLHKRLRDLPKQLRNIDVNNIKELILVVRFPDELNEIINSILILAENGIVYENNKIWHPEEVWIYIA